MFVKYFLAFTLLFSFQSHACGIAFVRLKKPLSSYEDPYWGLRKVSLLMEIQRNRGQDGAGLASATGAIFSCTRKSGRHALEQVFEETFQKSGAQALYLGHVRYATYGTDSVDCCQPYVFQDRFVLAGNFNLTNTSALYDQLVRAGRTPENDSDIAVLAKHLSLHIDNAPSQALEQWDGGYVFAGILETGEAFVFRDPAGIRPGFFYEDDDVFAVASERAALSNVFSCPLDAVQPLKPGHMLRIKQNGTIVETPFAKEDFDKECVFERIYFSQCYDEAIYNERKALGKNLAKRVLEALDYDLENAVFTFIPNSSEIAYLGLIEELRHLTGEKVRAEKLVHKNQKMRTFIANDASRKNLVSQLYAITKGIVQPTDTVVAVDDSIVRGTTLRESILTKLAELNPKRIIFVSSAPPVMYPDCYGIDMSQIGRFIAFQAAVELHRERGTEILSAKQIYAPWSLEQLSKKIAELVRPKHLAWKGDITILYQTLKGLHQAIPHHRGDWVFTGNYPTPGGFRVLNTSFHNWSNSSDKRAY